MRFKYHILIASLFLSVILWLSLNLNLTYEIQRSIPIKINLNRPYAIANFVPLNLDAKIKGSGWNLLKLYTSLNPELNYDIYPKANEVYIIPTKQILNDNSSFGQNLTVTFSKPETLFVKIGRYEERYVKVQPRVFVDCKDGYQIVGFPVTEPDSIKIGGSLAIINSLNCVFTSDLFLKNVNSSINEMIRLGDTLSNIIWRSQDEVNLYVRVELTAEKEFQNIEIKIPDIPPDREVLLSSLDNSKIIVSVDFKDLLADTSGSVKPKFTLPAGTVITSSRPEKVQYIIKNKF
jgi:hypothetical protein